MGFRGRAGGAKRIFRHSGGRDLEIGVGCCAFGGQGGWIPAGTGMTGISSGRDLEIGVGCYAFGGQGGWIPAGTGMTGISSGRNLELVSIATHSAGKTTGFWRAPE